MVDGVRDIKIARAVHGHVERIVKLSAGGAAAVAGETGFSGAGYRMDDPERVYHAHQMGGPFHEVNIPHTVHCQTPRQVDRGGDGRLSVSGRVRTPGARYRADDAGRDFTDPVVHVVGDVEVAQRIKSYGRGFVEIGVSGEASVAEVVGVSSRHRGDHLSLTQQ